MSRLHFITFLMLAGLLSFEAQAARVESINKNKVTLFLETSADEEIQDGDTVQLTDKSGRVKATLRVTTNRGLMADTIILSGTPQKNHIVKMPSEAKTAKKPKAKKAKVAKKGSGKPKYRAARTKTEESAVPQSMRAFVENEPDKIELDGVEDADEQVDNARQDVLDKSSRIPKPDESRARVDRAVKTATNRFRINNWNISVDLLSLAGLIYDYQVFSILAERRLGRSLSVGANVNFGTFESDRDAANPDNTPLVRRTEFGPFVRYNVLGDVLGNGPFVGGAVKLVQERWLAVGNFNGATDNGLVSTAILGYQWMVKSVTLRVGYQFQYSSMAEQFESDNGTFQRNNQLLSGTANYAVFQFGFMF